MPTQNFKILSWNGLPHYLKTALHFKKQLQTACLDFQNICAYNTWKHTPIVLRPSSLENNTRRIKQTLHAKAPFLQQHLFPFSFIFFPKKGSVSKAFSMMWKEMDNRQVAGGWRWAVASFTAIFPGTHRTNSQMTHAFPSRHKLMTFFSSKKILPNLLEPIHRMASLRVNSGHLSGIFPRLGVISPLWGGSSNDGSLSHLEVQSRALISSPPYSTPNCFPVTQTIRSILPCEASEDKSNPSFHGRHSTMLQWVVGPPWVFVPVSWNGHMS